MFLRYAPYVMIFAVLAISGFVGHRATLQSFEVTHGCATTDGKVGVVIFIESRGSEPICILDRKALFDLIAKSGPPAQ